MKFIGWVLAALSGVLFTVSLSAIAQQASSAAASDKQSATATACGADSSRPPLKSFAKGFTGGWQAVSETQLEAGTWGQVVNIWPRKDNAGTFLELVLRDDREAGDWAQVVDYCFGGDGKIGWIHSRFNSFNQDRRIEHCEFNASGTVTKHDAQCAKDSEETRPAEELCKDWNSFPMVKAARRFLFFEEEIPRQGPVSASAKLVKPRGAKC